MQDGQGPTCGHIKVSVTHTDTSGVDDETIEVGLCVTQIYYDIIRR